MYTIDEFDKGKTKVLKYILYKKEQKVKYAQNSPKKWKKTY